MEHSKLHFKVKCPPKSGSAFYNYKQYFSVVLMACVDADGIFLTIDIEDYGKNSDGRVFKISALGKGLEENTLDIPNLRPLPGWEDKGHFPYYFVADEAFPLKLNLMQPYPKRIYNYRCLRARRSVECAYSMLVSKFRLFEQPIGCKIKTAKSLIKAACVLHNFIRIEEGIFSTPSYPTAINSMGVEYEHERQNIQAIRPSRSAENNRHFLCEYFASDEGQVPWQEQFS